MGEMIIASASIILISLIAGISINGIVDKVMQAKRLRYTANTEATSQEIRAIAERQDMIEDRLRVLERIATDRGNLLADEIEALRGAARALPLAARGSEETVS